MTFTEEQHVEAAETDSTSKHVPKCTKLRYCTYTYDPKKEPKCLQSPPSPTSFLVIEELCPCYFKKNNTSL